MNKHKQHENEIAENDLVSYLEQKIGHLKPYWTQIILTVAVAIFGILAAVFIWDKSKEADAAKWQLLSIAEGNYRRGLDNTSLSDFADQYPDDKAGLWALVFAADAEVRAGLSDFSTDRKAGFDKIVKAQKFYKRVIDSDVQQTTMLQRRSRIGLANAYESNGDFEKAADLYKDLADLGDSNPFASKARRGLARSSNPEFVAFFEKFRNFELAPEVAPGLRLPKRPNISFPNPTDKQPEAGGGDFESGDADAPTGANESGSEEPGI